MTTKIRPRRRQGGFTLLEMLISLGVFSLLMIGLHRLAVTSEKSQEVGSRLTHVNQNIRSSLEIVSRDLRMAGSGFAGISVQTSNGPARQVIHPITPGYTGDAKADSVSVIAGPGDAVTVLAEPMAGPSDDIKCVSVEGFEAGNLVVITDGVSADMFEVTGVVPGAGPNPGELLHGPSSKKNNPAGHSAWPAGGYLAGARAVKVNQITLKVSNDGGAIKLLRRVDSSAMMPLIENVEALTFTYRMLDGTETRNPSSPAQIQEVIVTIEAGLRSGWGLEERSVTTSTSVRPRSVRA